MTSHFRRANSLRGAGRPMCPSVSAAGLVWDEFRWVMKLFLRINSIISGCSHGMQAQIRGMGGFALASPGTSRDLLNLDKYHLRPQKPLKRLLRTFQNSSDRVIV